MLSRWRDDQTDRFLDVYRKYECLWNWSNDLYRNKEAREAACKGMVNDIKLSGLNVTVDDVRKKIKIVRTNYKYELNKLRYSEKIKDEIKYVPRLFWFKKANEFLRDAIETKEFITSKMKNRSSHRIGIDPIAIPKQRVEEEEEEEEEKVVEDEDVVSISIYPIENLKIQNNTPPNKFTSPSTATKTGTKRLPPLSKIEGIKTIERPKKKPKFDHQNDDDNNFDAKRLPNPDTTDRTKIIKTAEKVVSENDDDEFDLFAKSIAVQLKKMPLNRALICQENLQKVIKEERLYQLSISNTEKILINNPSSLRSVSRSPVSFVDVEMENTLV